MAYRLGDYVVYGEIYNHNNYSTHGIIALRGKTEEDAHVIRIELTGNCDPDLRGIAFRFWPDEEWTKINGKIFKKREHKGFADFQIGPTGTMTAEGWARFVPCSVKEYLRRCELGEAPPTPWKRRLYLEWFSQNGRVVIELAGFKIEQCIRMGKGMEDEGDWEPLPNLALHPDEERARLRELGIEEDPDAQKPGLQITAIHLDGDNVEITDMSPPPELAGEGEDSSEGGIFSNGDSYESIPSALQKELDAQTASIDRAIGASSADDDDDDIIAEMKLMDACIDHAETKPLQAFLGDLSKLARASRPCVQ